MNIESTSVTAIFPVTFAPPGMRPNKLLKKITLDYIRILVATLVLLLAFGLLLGVI